MRDVLAQIDEREVAQLTEWNTYLNTIGGLAPGLTRHLRPTLVMVLPTGSGARRTRRPRTKPHSYFTHPVTGGLCSNKQLPTCESLACRTDPRPGSVQWAVNIVADLERRTPGQPRHDIATWCPATGLISAPEAETPQVSTCSRTASTPVLSPAACPFSTVSRRRLAGIEMPPAAKTKPTTGTEPGTGAGTDTGSESGAGADPGSGSGTDPRPGPGAGPGPGGRAILSRSCMRPLRPLAPGGQLLALPAVLEVEVTAHPQFLLSSPDQPLRARRLRQPQWRGAGPATKVRRVGEMPPPVPAPASFASSTSTLSAALVSAVSTAGGASRPVSPRPASIPASRLTGSLMDSLLLGALATGSAPAPAPVPVFAPAPAKDAKPTRAVGRAVAVPLRLGAPGGVPSAGPFRRSMVLAIPPDFETSRLTAALAPAAMHLAEAATAPAASEEPSPTAPGP
ncbi:hypothetical protein, variant [Fonticula alba]|uniref:Uncharacterized protein n=1 Tax=Fonticula alba TaxID=691883 RepID=A0A058Z709_FONAL|nr:hypothetical protein, variant [Fonticula alba]KCV69317.1 hypothetical protein, variant [Fonticula alba]|eukprot:XP_009495882.1 hypothetical protein, variant [Fonticula alba]